MEDRDQHCAFVVQVQFDLVQVQFDLVQVQFDLFDPDQLLVQELVVPWDIVGSSNKQFGVLGNNFGEILMEFGVLGNDNYLAAGDILMEFGNNFGELLGKHWLGVD